jgi:hypothetical protein
LQYRTRIIGLYPEIFGGNEEGNIDINFEGFTKKWGWAGFIYGLCNGDILNLDKVSELSIHTAFMYSAYKIDWQSIQNKIIKKGNRK